MERNPQELTTDELLEEMEAVLARYPSAKLFVKWTCPKCGERVTSTDANTFHSKGFYHDEDNCGALYTGPYWGYAAMFTSVRDANKFFGVTPEEEES